MLEFYQKHRQELKRPIRFIGIGAMILIVGAVTGNINTMATIFLGVGPIVFGLRDILALVMKDYS